MSIARNCPYSDAEENCRYEIFAWQPRLDKCPTCERFPDIDTSRYNIDENGNVLRGKGRMTDNTKTLYNALDKIKELEKENASLKAIRKYELNVAKLEIEKLEQRNDELEKEKCELLGIIQGKDKVIQELEKENAELKEQVENRNCSNCRRSKAKEIIKDYLTIAKGAHITECGVPEENRTIHVLKLNEEAEQFLNSEVEE